MAQTLSAEAGVWAPEKPWVGRSFSRAAGSYDGVAVLQRQVGEQLLARLGDISPAPRAVLDVGAGTGYCTARLAALFPDADVVALDIAEGMLQTLQGRLGLPGRVLCLCGDGEALPLRAGSVDRVFSNLALQWCCDLPAVLAEFRRVLRPGGVALFSIFGAGTLAELRTAWAMADGYAHVNAFLSEDTVAAALAAAGCSAYALSGERRVLRYADVRALLRELKALGAHNVMRGRPRHLTGKTAFGRMLAAYPVCAADGGIAASFAVIYGVAHFAEAGG
ncbi:MAG: malonyl-ACP O-methyltransferase BioC [Candidatus Methylumidiphilus sp.]